MIDLTNTYFISATCRRVSSGHLQVSYWKSNYDVSDIVQSHDFDKVVNWTVAISGIGAFTNDNLKKVKRFKQKPIIVWSKVASLNHRQ